MLALAGCPSARRSGPPPDEARVAAEIEAIQRDVVDAFNRHDAEAILRHVERSPNLRYVEHTQVTVGFEALQAGWRAWHAQNQDLRVKPLHTHVNVLNDSLAVLVVSGVIAKAGIDVQKYTWTAVFRRDSEGWRIVNAHEAFSGIEPPPDAGPEEGRR